jgi:hypothetical protein
VLANEPRADPEYHHPLGLRSHDNAASVNSEAKVGWLIAPHLHGTPRRDSVGADVYKPCATSVPRGVWERLAKELCLLASQYPLDGAQADAAADPGSHFCTSRNFPLAATEAPAPAAASSTGEGAGEGEGRGPIWGGAQMRMVA